MSYETGVITSGPNDLLDKLRVFLLADGWSVNEWADYDYNYDTGTGIDGSGKKLCVQKTSIGDASEMYFNFRSAVRGVVSRDWLSLYYKFTDPVTRYQCELTGIALNGSTGYAATQDYSITSVSNEGGKARLACTSYHGAFPGCSVTVAGTGVYDGVQTVTAVGTGTITIDTAYISTATGTVTTPRRWDAQPGASVKNDGYVWAVCMAELSQSSMPAYFFFSDGDTVVVVIEYTAGKYQFLSFGCLEKQGVYTGGQFFTGSFDCYQAAQNFYFETSRFFAGFPQYGSTPNGACYLDADASANWRISYSTTYGIIFSAPFPYTYADKGNRSFGSYFVGRTPNSFNSLAPMCPLYVFTKRSDSYLSLLGWPKSIRIINTTNYSGGDEIVYGGDTWKIFRETAYGAEPAYYGKTGFAIKKVV